VHKMEGILVAAIASVVSMAVSAQVGQPRHPEKPTYKYEKCYGIAKAGQNDCFTAANACGGTVKEAARADAWMYLPKGTCGKVTGGSLEPGVRPGNTW
jgi:uncharacterized membrane protein